jgi:hypothetical protein
MEKYIKECLKEINKMDREKFMILKEIYFNMANG